MVLVERGFGWSFALMAVDAKARTGGFEGAIAPQTSREKEEAAQHNRLQEERGFEKSDDQKGKARNPTKQFADIVGMI